MDRLALINSNKSCFKITIITVCYNNEKTIYDTLKSVSNQVGVDIEHIIVDGASKDSTLAVVKQFPHVNRVLSEPDKGIYDAMNKGIALATGDVIGTLNADDFYVTDSVLEEVSKIFENPAVDACFADLVYVDQHVTSKTVRYWKSRDYVPGLFKSGWMPAHPTFFARKSVYERFGMFNLNYKIAADFELLFRLIEQNNITTKYLPKVLLKMRLGGTTNKSISNIMLQNKEIIAILKNQYSDISLVKFILNKLFDRFFQYILRP